jgi:hypothetical protein
MTGPFTDLALGGRGLAEAAEAHPAQDAVRLGELDLVVLDDLDKVASWVAEDEAVAAHDLGAGALQPGAHGAH